MTLNFHVTNGSPTVYFRHKIILQMGHESAQILFSLLVDYTLIFPSHAFWFVGLTNHRQLPAIGGSGTPEISPRLPLPLSKYIIRS